MFLFWKRTEEVALRATELPKERGRRGAGLEESAVSPPALFPLLGIRDPEGPGAEQIPPDKRNKYFPAAPGTCIPRPTQASAGEIFPSPPPSAPSLQVIGLRSVAALYGACAGLLEASIKE